MRIVLGALLGQGQLRIVDALIGEFPRGVYRALDVLRGTTYWVGVARLDEETSARLAAWWPARGGSALRPLPGHDGYYTVAEPEGMGVPLTHLLGQRHTLRSAVGLVSELVSALAASSDRRPGRFHPALMCVTVEPEGLTLQSVATRIVELLEHALGEFPAPLLTPSLFAPESLLGRQPTTTAAQVFSSAALLAWLVHGVPPFGATPIDEAERMSRHAPVLGPLLDHIDPGLGTFLPTMLSADPARRPPLAEWAQGLRDMVQARFPEPPARPRPAAPVESESALGLAIAIKGLAAARYRGPIPDAARADWHDVTRAILAGLAASAGTPVAAACPELAELWAVATTLGDDVTLDALSGFMTPPRVRTAIAGEVSTDLQWRFVACMAARDDGRPWRAEAAALMAEEAASGACHRNGVRPWLRAIAALDPPAGQPVRPVTLTGKSLQRALDATVPEGSHGVPETSIVDDGPADPLWMTLALQRLARDRGHDVALTPVSGLPRWPFVATPAPTVRGVLAEAPRGIRLVLERGFAGQRDGWTRITLNGRGHARIETQRGRFARGFEGPVGRTRARAVLADVSALWDRLPTPGAWSTQDFAEAQRAWQALGQMPFAESLLGVEHDGRAVWRRLDGSAESAAIVSEFEAMARDILDPETWKPFAQDPEIGLRPELRMLLSACVSGGSPSDLERLTEAIPFSRDALALAEAELHSGVASALEAQHARASATILRAAAAPPPALPGCSASVGEAKPLAVAWSMAELVERFESLAVASYDAALPLGRIRFANARGETVAEARCAVLFSWSARDLLWGSDVPGFVAAGVPCVPRPWWQPAHLAEVDPVEAAAIARAASRETAVFVYRAPTPTGFLYLEIHGFVAR